jgi:hypothetical protein
MPLKGTVLFFCGDYQNKKLSPELIEYGFEEDEWYCLNLNLNPRI